MSQRREQELLLLMAIARHADPLGFCFPGRARLMKMRHSGERKHDERVAFLEECGYIVMTETYDHRRRQTQFDIQVSPRALYVRPEFQVYCEAVFDTAQTRDFSVEKNLLENLFSTKDSQPEVVPESETESETRHRNQLHKQHHNQRAKNALKPKKQGPNNSTMRNGPQTATAKQPTAADATAHRKDNPQAGGPDEFAALLHVDTDRLIQEIKHIVSTTDHQAKRAIDVYPREAIVHCLEITARRRAQGELNNPGGYFFKLLFQRMTPTNPPGPNGQ